MTRILVAEDSKTQAAHIKYCLEHAGYEVEVAVDGLAALAAIARHVPDLVVTDLQMPEMDGLELVVAVGREHPALPVVLLTHEGSEDMALAALARGAAGFSPKSQLQQGVAGALHYVLHMGRAELGEERVSQSLVQAHFQFQLESDESLIVPLAVHWECELLRFGHCGRPAARQMALALAEVLDNAIRHGNLELNSALGEQDEAAYQRLAAQRRSQSPYCDRRVYLDARISNSEAVCTVRDEGPGFDFSILNQVGDPATLVESHGSGLVLIRHLVDHVEHNSQGNQITLVKRRQRQT